MDENFFDNYEFIPLELAPIVEFWSERIENGEDDGYTYCDKFLKECEEHGYAFEYDPDGQPYFLRP
ncbi:hypothetical protein ACR1PO_03265 [Chryseobacterium sp. RRHN12]|uniref:hypothetical protein n=1 Tax=Chryseobacterium sp. RRHN12 TaxID=3437884 RepID=UPI003D9B2E12